MHLLDKYSKILQNAWCTLADNNFFLFIIHNVGGCLPGNTELPWWLAITYRLL